VLILSISLPDTFFTGNNFASILLNVSLFGIMTAGMIFPALVSGPDLAVGGQVAIGSAIVVKVIAAHDYSAGGVIVGVLLVILVGIVIGLIHGTIVYYFKQPSFLITLATQYILFGLTQLITDGKILSCTKPELFTWLGSGRIFGIAVPVYALLLIAVITLFLLNYTVYGRKVYAVGGNQKAAALCGISNSKIVISAFVICSIYACLSGVLLASINQQATPVAGSGYEFEVLLSIVIGGIVMGGGVGSLPGALYGAIFVGLLNNSMRLLGVPSMFQTLIKGILIIVVVAIDVYAINKSSGLVRKNRLFKRLKDKTHNKITG
jgi:ribose/xylose/arabinose/galactoside ABC-type transport system permease subunit